MSDIAIRSCNIGKLYRLGQHGPHRSLREAITEGTASLFQRISAKLRSRKQKSETDHLWALKDVSFEIRQGEVVGIIGRNGAGKSTLLKILSRITEPTTGYAEIHGRVGSLLEVGTGFHPELTGKENIFLNGAILGMRRGEILRKFDEIVAFAEIEKFLDTPVKRYSSGMYVRLAFAVAAHLEPEILLVDEVLAVGDAAFQKKCLGKMGDVARKGRTVFFVSHNMAAVRSMCPRCILLSEGRVECDGPTNTVVERYLAHHIGDIPSEVNTVNWDRPDDGLGTDLKVIQVRIRTTADGAARVLADEPFVVEMDMEVTKPVEEVVYGFAVYSMEGSRLFQCHNTNDSGRPHPRLEQGRYRVTATVDDIRLPPGRYRLDVGARCSRKGLDWLRDLMFFDVEDVQTESSPWFKAEDGLFRQPSRWQEPELLG